MSKPRMFRLLDGLGLKRGVDYVGPEDARSMAVDGGDEGINIVCHHHSSALSDWQLLGADLVKPVAFSFYADGYTNILLHKPEIAAFLSEYPAINRRDLFFFGIAPRSEAEYASAFKPTILEAGLLAGLAGMPVIVQSSDEASAQLESWVAGNPWALLVLRPWGSETFQRGLYSLNDPVNVHIEIISRVCEELDRHMGSNFSVVVRPDHRDELLMEKLMSGISESSSAMMRNALNLDAAWPKGYTLDPFLYLMPKLISDPMVTASFDSTAMLPFVELGIGHSHYFGLPDSAIELIGDANVLSTLTAKIRLLRRHVEGLGQSRDLAIETLGESFFRVSARC